MATQLLMATLHWFLPAFNKKGIYFVRLKRTNQEDLSRNFLLWLNHFFAHSDSSGSADSGSDSSSGWRSTWHSFKSEDLELYQLLPSFDKSTLLGCTVPETIRNVPSDYLPVFTFLSANKKQLMIIFSKFFWACKGNKRGINHFCDYSVRSQLLFFKDERKPEM